jgi:hypothetical protein
MSSRFASGGFLECHEISIERRFPDPNLEPEIRRFDRARSNPVGAALSRLFR